MATSGESSIMELQAILSQEPFSFDKSEKIKLVSRYLVENNDESYIHYNPNTKQMNTIILSIFRKLTGKYTIFTEEEEQENFEFFCYVREWWCFFELFSWEKSMVKACDVQGKYCRIRGWRNLRRSLIKNLYTSPIRTGMKSTKNSMTE